MNIIKQTLYNRQVMKWLKECYVAWRKHEIDDYDYLGMVVAITSSDKYSQFSFDFAFRHYKEQLKREKEYKESLKQKEK